MENAAEYIVRVYLESQKYLVRTNEKFYFIKEIKTKRGLQKQRTPIEVDVLGMKKGDKIVGEVKTWFGSTGVHIGCFKKLTPEKWINTRGGGRFKVINDSVVRKALFKQVEAKYGTKHGRGFRYILFLGKFKSTKDKVAIYKYISKLKINNKPVQIIEFDTVLDILIKKVRKSPTEYTNDRIFETLKILDFYGKLEKSG